MGRNPPSETEYRQGIEGFLGCTVRDGSAAETGGDRNVETIWAALQVTILRIERFTKRFSDCLQGVVPETIFVGAAWIFKNFRAIHPSTRL
jgi:hypothetical protein